jgi:hypothetical protein
MLNMMKLSCAAVLASLVLTGCNTVPRAPVDVSVYRQHMPKSILVLPPLNNSPDVRATYSFWSTVTRPIAEAGYYVFPVALVDQTFKENGVTTAGDAHSIAPQKLQEIFGADAALYITVTEYGSKYMVLNSVTSVAATAKLIDLKTGEQLWQGTRRIAMDSNANNQNGLIGALVGALVEQIAGNVSDRSHDVSAMVSGQLFTPNLHVGDALLFGVRSPKYQADGVTAPAPK